MEAEAGRVRTHLAGAGMSMKTVPCQYCRRNLLPNDVFVHTQYQCPKRPGATVRPKKEVPCGH